MRPWRERRGCVHNKILWENHDKNTLHYQPILTQGPGTAAQWSCLSNILIFWQKYWYHHSRVSMLNNGSWNLKKDRTMVTTCDKIQWVGKSKATTKSLLSILNCKVVNSFLPTAMLLSGKSFRELNLNESISTISLIAWRGRYLLKRARQKCDLW